MKQKGVPLTRDCAPCTPLGALPQTSSSDLRPLTLSLGPPMQGVAYTFPAISTTGSIMG